MCVQVEVGVWFRGTVHTNLDAGLAGERATWGQTQHFKKTVHTLTGCSPYKWKCMEPKQRAHSARCSAHTHTHTPRRTCGDWSGGDGGPGCDHVDQGHVDAELVRDGLGHLGVQALAQFAAA